MPHEASAGTQMKPSSTVVTYPLHRQSIPSAELKAGLYRARFAQTEEELDHILRLRYEVFNLELNEGFEESHQTARDRDEFDEQCHHLMVYDTRDGSVVGTYRMQTARMAADGNGFYSAGEFDLSSFPDWFLENTIELGRACVAAHHRNGRVLYLLWRGLAQYLKKNDKQFFFGCCSLTSQDPAEARQVFEYLGDHGHLHPELAPLPQPGFAALDPAVPSPGTQPDIPKLMRLYLEHGARIAGEPAIDREFKTIDYLAVLDIREISPQTHRMVFQNLEVD